MIKRSFLIILLLLNSYFSFNQNANFIIPDTVCVNQSVNIQNTSIGAITNYWNFCSGNLAAMPIGLNIGNLGSLSGPVYTAIAKDGNNYYVFITNYTNGTLTRLSFGNSLINAPVATNLGNLGGVLGGYLEGIQIKKDSVSGIWYGLIVNGQNNYLVRLNFGNSLNNIPTAINLGNIGGLMNYPHAIYTFKENGNWYSLVTNFYSNNILRLNFGNSLSNTPTIISLGNVGLLNGPVGLYPIIDNNNWYLFVTNQYSNSLSRLNFGNSLLNNPTGINLGNINSTMNDPRAITFIRDCGQVYGFVVNEITNDMVRLTFPNGLTSIPSGSSLGNLANFSFPHHISELFRVGDSLYTFIVNEVNHTISRICFTSCNNSTQASSNIHTPPSFSYNTPGIYNISLVINEGTPTQSNICKNIVVVNSITATITGSSVFCVGDSIKLTGNSVSGCTYQWSGPNGFTSNNQSVVISNSNQSNSGNYTLIVSKNGCTSNPIIKAINIVNKPIVNLGNDTSLCQGFVKILNAGNSGSLFNWNTGQTSQSINVINSGTYTVKVTNTNGCSSRDTININFLSKPNVNLGNDTTICQGNTLILNAANSGCTYLWNTNQTSQSINVSNSGVYSVKVTNSNACIGYDTIHVNISPFLPVNIGNDTAICTGNTIVLNAANSGCTYYWSTNQTSQSINVNNQGIYWVKVTNSNNCYGFDTINISILPKPSVNLGNDTTICQGNTIVLNASNSGSTYLWNTNQTTQTINVNNAGVFSVKVTNSNACIGYDTINVNILPKPIVNLGNDTTICQGNTIVLNAFNFGSTYLWNTNQSTQSINVNNAGAFSVIVTNSNGCIGYDTINISISPHLAVNLGNDTTICEGESVVLNAAYPGANYLWNTNATSQTINVGISGNYWVNVNQNGCNGSDSILINTVSKPLISLGNDTIMCPDELVILTPGAGFNSYLWSNGATTSSINVDLPGIYSVIVSNGACLASDEIVIEECGSEIWIPNVFTPNGDGINEYFFPVFTNIDNITMLIFNRWGNQLYEGSGKDLRWDGRFLGNQCSDGVYYYVIEYEQKGKLKGLKKRHGSVTLLH